MSQPTIDQMFPQAKPKTSAVKSFYGKKTEVSPLKIFTANLVSQTVYTPTVKKMILLSSDESDSDSDSNFVVKNKRAINNSDQENVNNGASPPKQRKHVPSPKKTPGRKVSTLSTPVSSRLTRQRKAETPSTQMSNLELSPKKSTKKSTTRPRKNLFAENYSEARLALHSSVPTNLVGRDEEVGFLVNYINEHVKSKRPGSIYISGPPGTGKTAALSKIVEKLPKNVAQVYVNCTSLKSPNAIYMRICEELKLQSDEKDSKNVAAKYFQTSHPRSKPILMVLDEIDNLESKNQSVLYTIFEWPNFPKSKLILIGISNTLDLTDRILPRLQARSEVKPEVMHFKPYTNEQIVSIITDRLKQTNVHEIFTENALIFLAKKISAISGDIRKTLDICRRLFEIAETQRNVLQKENSSSELKKVDVKEVLSILNQVYGGSQNIDEAEDKFPLQQKLLLCSLMLLLNNGKNKDVTISRLYTVYKKVCLKRRISFVDIPEFVSFCSLIESRGIIKVISKKDKQLSKIGLVWDQDQLNAALSDKMLTSSIINDTSCL